MIGSSNFLLFDFVINYLKDLRLPTVSILDFILDSTANSLLPQWDGSFDFTNQEDYDEPYLSYDIGEKIFNALGLSNIYGDQEYFNIQLV